MNHRHGNTEVVLDEGSVRLTPRNESISGPILMQPGDYVALSAVDTVFRKQTVRPEKYSAWQSNMLVFEDTPLHVVAQKIEDYYGLEITISNSELARRQLTGTLPNNDLGVVLRSLSVSHNLEVIRESDRIIFR